MAKPKNPPPEEKPAAPTYQVERGFKYGDRDLRQGDNVEIEAEHVDDLIATGHISRPRGTYRRRDMQAEE